MAVVRCADVIVLMPVEFTDEEKAALLEGIVIAGALIDPFELIEEILANIDIDALENTILASISGDATPEVLAAARAAANKQAKQITGDLIHSELVKIAAKVEANIAAGKSPLDLIRALDEIKGLDAPRAATLERFKDALIEDGVYTKAEVDALVDRERERLLKKRRETIARTEQANASAEGHQSIALARGAKFKISISAGDERVSDICQTNEAQGYIPIGEPFASGDMNPTYHPNCRCAVAYKTIQPDASDKQFAEEIEAKTTEAKGTS